jgi:hypothetical protein
MGLVDNKQWQRKKKKEKTSIQQSNYMMPLRAVTYPLYWIYLPMMHYPWTSTSRVLPWGGVHYGRKVAAEFFMAVGESLEPHSLSCGII